MGKKRQRKPEPAGNRSAGGNHWLRRFIVLFVALMVALGIGLFFGGPAQEGKSFQVTGGETRPVLNAAMFVSGRASLAYAVAKKYPEVMDQVYCYCKCDRPPFNHKSLLSCFTDSHGAS